jgi:hypothetical protein
MFQVLQSDVRSNSSDRLHVYTRCILALTLTLRLASVLDCRQEEAHGIERSDDDTDEASNNGELAEIGYLPTNSSGRPTRWSICDLSCNSGQAKACGACHSCCAQQTGMHISWLWKLCLLLSSVYQPMRDTVFILSCHPILQYWLTASTAIRFMRSHPYIMQFTTTMRAMLHWAEVSTLRLIECMDGVSKYLIYKSMFTNGFVLGIQCLTHTLTEAGRNCQNENCCSKIISSGYLNDVVRPERDYDPNHEQEPEQEHGYG